MISHEIIVVTTKVQLDNQNDMAGNNSGYNKNDYKTIF